MNKKKDKKKKGFTLIELIAVIAILAILGAVLIPNVLSYRNKAEKSNIQTNAKQLIEAINAYNADKDASNSIDKYDATSSALLVNDISTNKVPSCLTGAGLNDLENIAGGAFNVNTLDGLNSTIDYPITGN